MRSVIYETGMGEEKRRPRLIGMRKGDKESSGKSDKKRLEDHIDDL